MSTLLVFRQAMMNWNRFVTACILAAALLLKFGVPLPAILIGLSAAALVNWQIRPRLKPAPLRREPTPHRREIARSDV
jgi:hypothetical protein